jgi:hypothetical protein
MGAVGTNIFGDYQGGNGGIGLATYSAWGSATSTGQNVSGIYYYAGGGGGYSDYLSVGGNGGYGGGGHTGVDALANTGGGAGSGNGSTGKNGGSGVVIVRYLISAV